MAKRFGPGRIRNAGYKFYDFFSIFFYVGMFYVGMSWSRDAEAVLSENHSLVWRWLSSHLAGQTVQHFQNWGL